jgi:Fur family transcriptional regulator, stress-responsive regulator
VCRLCGRTEDVDCAAGEQPCLTPATEQGYSIDEAEVVFWGVCPACQAADSPVPEAQYNQEGWQ